MYMFAKIDFECATSRVLLIFDIYRKWEQTPEKLSGGVLVISKKLKKSLKIKEIIFFARILQKCSS